MSARPWGRPSPPRTAAKPHLPAPRRPPFHSADPRQIYSRILDGVFSFPAFLGEAACSLIGKLCRWGGTQRGALRGGGAQWGAPGRAEASLGGIWVPWVRHCAPACMGGTALCGGVCVCVSPGVPPQPLLHAIPLQAPAGAAPGEHGQRHPRHQEAQVRGGGCGGPAPPPAPPAAPPRPPRWFGALKWRKLSLRQLEAPTLRLIKEVRRGPGGAQGPGGLGGPALTPSPAPGTPLHQLQALLG